MRKHVLQALRAVFFFSTRDGYFACSACIHKYIAGVHAFVHTFVCERFLHILAHAIMCTCACVDVCKRVARVWWCATHELNTHELTHELTHRFHLRDLVGRGSVEIKETTAGPLAKVIAGAKAS